MADYYNPGGYPPPPRPGSGQNSYPPPPRPQQYEGSQGYSSPAPQSSYGYRPAREDQYNYSPRSSGMQVGQYAGSEYEHGRQRRNSGPYAASQYRGTEASYYAPPSEYDDRPSSRGSRGSRGSRRERDGSRGRGEKHGNHDGAKELGATLAGGAIGGWAGHELGHSNPLVTVATALAGAYAGHKLEGKHEKDKVKKRERRASQGGGYDDYREGRRSRSRSRSIVQRLRRSLSRKRSSSESSSDSDDSRRRRHHRH